MALVTCLYEATSVFPASEQFGLVAQIRRATVSVPSNISEGASRGSRRDFIRFLLIARGSLSELDTQIRIAENLGFVDDASSIIEELGRLRWSLSSLIKVQQARITS
nr:MULTISPECIES: four helix bundle protein [Dyella]